VTDNTWCKRAHHGPSHLFLVQISLVEYYSTNKHESEEGKHQQIFVHWMDKCKKYFKKETRTETTRFVRIGPNSTEHVNPKLL
jgi:hypothetical protein